MKCRIATLAATALLCFAVTPAVAAQGIVHAEKGKTLQTKSGSCVHTKGSGSTGCGAKAEAEAAAPAPSVAPAAPQQAAAPALPPMAPQMVQPAPRLAPPAVKPMPRTVVSKEARTIYFDFGKDTLSADAKQRLSQLVATLNTAADVQQARIIGYADKMGNKQRNYELSERRAKAVEAFLHEQGFTNTAVAKTRAVGEAAANAGCAKKKNRHKKIACGAEDRKVEIEIVTTSPALR